MGMAQPNGWTWKKWENYPDELRPKLEKRFRELRWPFDGWQNGHPKFGKKDPYAMFNRGVPWLMVEKEAQALLDEKAEAEITKHERTLPPPRKDASKPKKTDKPKPSRRAPTTKKKTTRKPTSKAKKTRPKTSKKTK